MRNLICQPQTKLNMACKKSEHSLTLKYETSGGPGEAGGGGPLPGHWLFRILKILLSLFSFSLSVEFNIECQNLQCNHANRQIFTI